MINKGTCYTSKKTQTFKNLPIFLEGSDNMVTAGGKRSVPRTSQGHSNKLPNFNTRGRPAVAINATGDPPKAAVGATCTRDFLW